MIIEMFKRLSELIVALRGCELRLEIKDDQEDQEEEEKKTNSNPMKMEKTKRIWPEKVSSFLLPVPSTNKQTTVTRDMP